MGNFRREDRGGFGGGSRGGFGGGRGGFRDRDSDDGGFGGGRGGFGRDRGERRPLEMHEVVCDKCKKKCEVPFKPTAGKPVYCRECFDKNDSKNGGVSSAQLDEVNAKLDKILKLLEKE